MYFYQFIPSLNSYVIYSPFPTYPTLCSVFKKPIKSDLCCPHSLRLCWLAFALWEGASVLSQGEK